jgi:glutamyl-tRNA synthetase
MNVRVRYAPSPTGKQHIGGVRTALFNYLFARSEGGTFILRIEDTDRERSSDEALSDIYDTFQWLGISWDEGPDTGGAFGPYMQSQRKDIYQQYAEKLIETGRAYRCYCTPERLKRLREAQQKEKKSFGYDRHCRSLTVEERERFEKEGKKSVIRLKIPLEGETAFHDELLGEIKRANRDINPDPVLLKTDGYPTYHLANVIDDHLMKVTHILRAQEWIPSVPLHVIIYRAFDWQPPKFCHLPMVLGKDGQKLSKRHGATSICDLRKTGYLPEALINYIALLGWAYDDSREFFTVKELESLFTLSKLNKAPGVFDYKKLDWFNGRYIRGKKTEELKKLVLPYLLEEKLIQKTGEEEKKLNAILPIVQERLKVLSDIIPLTSFFFKEARIDNPSELIPKKIDKQKTLSILIKCAELLNGFEARSNEENEVIFRDAAESLQVRLGDLLLPLRVAMTGSRVSPPLIESIRILGMEKVKTRISNAIALLKG